MISKIKFPLRQLVEIDWIDTHTQGGWSTREQYAKDSQTPYDCRSTGYVLQRTRTAVTLIQTQAALPNGKVSDAITIPRQTIRKVRRLR